MPNVAVSMLTCNDREWSTHTLLSLLQSDLMQFDPLISVVDNGSTDGTLEMLRIIAANHPQVRVVRNPVNVGIITARNQSFWQLLALAPRLKYIVEVHNDMLFPRQWAQNMVQFMEDHPKVAMACPRILTSRHWVPDLKAPDIQDQVDARCAAATGEGVDYVDTVGPHWQVHPDILRVSDLKAAGFYDDNLLWQEYEDTDLVLKFLAAERDIAINHMVCCYHYYGMTRYNFANPKMAGNRAYMRQKWENFEEVFQRIWQLCLKRDEEQQQGKPWL